MKTGTWIIVLIIVILIAVAVFIASKGPQKPEEPEKYDEFAQCLQDQGAIFYGAFWCPHCNNQKDMFGQSAELLPYVECSTPDGTGQLEVCQEAGITGYPTWVFTDGERISGEVPLETLAEKTGCPLPE